MPVANPILEDDMVPLLTDVSAGKLLGKSPMTLWRWRRDGIGPPFITLPNGGARYSLRDLEEWVARNRTTPDECN
jgi:hypothetical protein